MDDGFALGRFGFGDWGLQVSFEPTKIFSDISHEPRVVGSVSPYRAFLKRVLDIVLVLLAAPFVLPVVLVIAAFVMRDGHSPFYWSERVGRHGRVFRMMKLRTMVHDAHGCLEAYLATDPEAAAEWAETQKLKRDPRITPFGRMLRKTSLDELPQLWNVLIGDMSLVGPRPMMTNQQHLYPGEAYYGLRPGITGLWQVSARNNSDFADRAAYDHDYDRRLSFSTDLKLLLATVAVVMHGTGH